MGDGGADFAADDQESFRRQEFVFASLHLLLIGALLALQAITRFVRGRPSASVIIVLAVGLTVQAAHLIWLRRRNAPLSRLARQKQLGVVPQTTQLAPWAPGVKHWDELSADKKRVAARLMENYAGFGEYTDH